MRRALRLGLTLVLLTGCALQPTPQQLATADYGPLPDHWQALARGAFEWSLYDPFSAQYRFNAPEPGWVSNTSQIVYGWRITGLVNAKNRMGGYVGWRAFAVLLRHGAVVSSTLSTR